MERFTPRPPESLARESPEKAAVAALAAAAILHARLDNPPRSLQGCVFAALTEQAPNIEEAERRRLANLVIKELRRRDPVEMQKYQKNRPLSALPHVKAGAIANENRHPRDDEDDSET